MGGELKSVDFPNYFRTGLIDISLLETFTPQRKIMFAFGLGLFFCLYIFFIFIKREKDELPS